MKHDKIAVAIATRGGKVLMVRRKKRDSILDWVFPGGKIAWLETPAQAARRETKEESGVDCQPVTTLRKKIHPVTVAEITYVWCQNKNGAPRVRRPQEIEDARWVTMDEAEQRTHGFLDETVREFLANKASSPDAMAVPA